MIGFLSNCVVFHEKATAMIISTSNSSCVATKQQQQAEKQCARPYFNDIIIPLYDVPKFMDKNETKKAKNAVIEANERYIANNDMHVMIIDHICEIFDIKDEIEIKIWHKLVLFFTSLIVTIAVILYVLQGA